MQESLTGEQALKIGSSNGIEVFYIKTRKFKTNSINIFFQSSLMNKTATKNALLPAVLRRGCKNFPTFRDIALYLEELYGSSFDCGVVKKGEQQIVQFYADFILDRYTKDTSNLFEKVFDLLYQIINDPVSVNGAFNQDYIAQEKDNLKKLIESRVNDKVQYAVERCYEEMCRDEPFGIYEYGNVADLNSIDEKNLFEHYVLFLSTLPVKVYICGDIEHSRLERIVQKLFGIKRGPVKNIEHAGVKKEVSGIKDVTEKMDVNQGKLSLGFRTNTSACDENYYSLLVYNGILGGGVHSKLFQNVREKAGLVYYVFSRLEKFKGLMLIGCGIDPANKDKAQELIMKQLDEMKKGNITDREFEAAVKALETGISSLKDSQLQMVDFYLNQAVAGTKDTLDSIVDKVKRVRKDDVVNMANKITLDTVYFLTPQH